MSACLLSLLVSVPVPAMSTSVPVPFGINVTRGFPVLLLPVRNAARETNESPLVPHASPLLTARPEGARDSVPPETPGHFLMPGTGEHPDDVLVVVPK